MSVSQYEYYQKLNFHPDSMADHHGEEFSNYLRIRKHLYQDLLNIPLGLLAEKKVLDIGCGAGESSLFLAMHGAQLSLVDADESTNAPLEALFRSFNLTDSITKKSFVPMEIYEDDLRYAFITAEGFLFTLTNRDELLRKICTLLQPGGIACISFPERIGSFLEFLKKAILWRAYQLAGVDDLTSPEAEKIAWRLFEPAYRRLNNPRPFTIWWKDCLISPFLTWQHCWDYQTILSVIEQEGCAFYSSIPRIYEPDHLSWYKRLDSDETTQEARLAGLARRRLDFLYGEPIDVDTTISRIETINQGLETVLHHLSRYFRSLQEDVPTIAFKPIAEMIKEAGVNSDLTDEMVSFFDALKYNNLDQLMDHYRACKELNTRWGCSLHHICFTKETSVIS
ncbi:MAG: methyltransferase domain-containing protein [Magnetococcales bacterium]|nr:methyltransferase domain-containing protein [Magnetococcales bacterium]